MASQLLGTPPIHYIPKYSSQLLGTLSIHRITNKQNPAEDIFLKKYFLIYLECTERITLACFSLKSDKYFHPQPVSINNFSIEKYNLTSKKKKKIWQDPFPKLFLIDLTTKFCIKVPPVMKLYRSSKLKLTSVLENLQNSTFSAVSTNKLSQLLGVTSNYSTELQTVI